MTYEAFRRDLISFKIFSISDVRKAFLHFDSRRLVEWQKKGYIQKLTNKWYYFSEIPLTEHLLQRISNCLHHPSYISLESAISFYHIIPEHVFTHQAVSTRKTILYETPAGNFNYRSIKKELYFGYQIIYNEGLPVVIADLEKAILDYLYLNPSVKTGEDIQGLRWNFDEIQNQLDWEKLHNYKILYNSKILDKRVSILKKMLLNAHSA